MKAKTANIYIYLFTAATVVVSFIQPTVIHQIVTWVAGAFCVLVVLALFAIGNWRGAAVVNNVAPTADAVVLGVIAKLRHNGWDDNTIASLTGFDIDVIKAVPR